MPSPEVLRWYYFIPRFSDEGRRWYEEYNSATSMTLGQKLDDALNLMRDHQVADGFRLLQECKDEIDRTSENHSTAVTTVLDRWYLSTLAYYYYLNKDYEAASQSLKDAVTAIESAIGEAPFLVVMASACCELRLHEARIARYARRWDDMKRHIELGRQMIRSEFPLCRVGERGIRFLDVDRFHRSISAESEDEEEALDLLLNDSARVYGYESAIRGVGILPNVVVPFS